MTNNNVSIEKFLNSVDGMINSKYILVDRKISDVLLSIAETREVYNLIARCMVNFDFRDEWKRATVSSVLKLPENDAKRISFIFCMLNNFDDKNLDVTKILERFFSYDKTISPYDLFCKCVVEEFKKLIMRNLNIQIPEEEIATAETSVAMNEFEVLLSMLKNFASLIVSKRNIKHCFMAKNDLLAVVSTLEQIVEKHQVEYFYAFQVTINNCISKDKDLKKAFADANRIIDEIIKGVV